jgi:Domain of unknown function (DUF4276)
MRLYVEGGGDSNFQRTACRRGFSEFLRKAGLEGHMPRIVASGGRNQAYQDFCTAIKSGVSAAMLLVDSEEPIVVTSPWRHLLSRSDDRWQAPTGSTDDDCHLMVQCMESWFLADREALEKFFGQGFNSNALPTKGSEIEVQPKESVYKLLAAATIHCKTKSVYSKGKHSFDLLAEIDPAKVTDNSQWADRFVKALKNKMGC